MVEMPGDLRIQTAPVFEPLLGPARYRAAWGGRGSGKSHFFAELLVERCIEHPGTFAVCVREVQRTLSQSAKLLIEMKIKALGVEDRFRCLTDRIETPGGGSIIFLGMQDSTTAEGIKSLEGRHICWIEEAQTISHRSLSLLRPTIRAEGSEIWASWNPRRKTDAIDEFLRVDPPGNAIIVKANWADNPWFPDVLEEERLFDLERYPERYGHIWEGEYARAFEGAYFSSLLTQAESQGRICRIGPDPILPIRAFWDLGGAGARGDATAIWIVQFVGREIRVLDYLEASGQVLAYHVHELRRRGWGEAFCTLPHDGVNTNSFTGKRYSDHIYEAGFEVEVIPNQGRGAAMQRIEAVRRIFPQVWFNADTTEAGRDALGFYHENRDADRNVGLGPAHDWSSHAADAFGLMAICYEEPMVEEQDRAWEQDYMAGRDAITGY